VYNGIRVIPNVTSGASYTFTGNTITGVTADKAINAGIAIGAGSSDNANGLARYPATNGGVTGSTSTTFTKLTAAWPNNWLEGLLVGTNANTITDFDIEVCSREPTYVSVTAGQCTDEGVNDAVTSGSTLYYNGSTWQTYSTSSSYTSGKSGLGYT
jgi:hypothetical protein